MNEPRPPPTACPHLLRLDPRCFAPRLRGIDIADLVYYCGDRWRECPHRARIEAEFRARAGVSA